MIQSTREPNINWGLAGEVGPWQALEWSDYVDPQTLNWYAVKVRPQHEKLTCGAIHSKGYETFLPLGRFLRAGSERVRAKERPLFPGYIFCRFDTNRRLPILITPGVVHIVG